MKQIHQYHYMYNAHQKHKKSINDRLWWIKVKVVYLCSNLINVLRRYKSWLKTKNEGIAWTPKGARPVRRQVSNKQQ